MQIFTFFLLSLSFSIFIYGNDVSKDHEPESVVTEHTITTDGKTFSYKATVGMLPIKDDFGAAKGSIFYTAYEKTDSKDLSKRPITFCFNGGPGSASVWLHLGILGPMRIALKNEAYQNPPYSYIPNEYSLLDATDLVFIDPISTGYSRAFDQEELKQFHNVEGDAKWLSEWIRQYITRNQRWDSPKFLIGESYGTLRAVEMTQTLHDDYGIYLNGIMLISSILDFQTLDKYDKSCDLPFILYLPSLTAAAWYHNKLAPELQNNFQEALKQSKEFAVSEYSVALLLGDLLSEEKYREIARKVAYFTGISQEYVEKANLRLTLARYSKELLRNDLLVIGRFDSRVTGYSPDPQVEYATYDPSLNTIIGPFTAVAQSYFASNLKWMKDSQYKVLTNMQPAWEYTKAQNRFFSALPTLRDILVDNMDLHVFVASGYYDLATPYFSTEYTFNHLNLDQNVKDRITMDYYDGGHMMYLQLPELIKLNNDMHAFIRKTLQ